MFQKMGCHSWRIGSPALKEWCLLGWTLAESRLISRQGPENFCSTLTLKVFKCKTNTLSILKDQLFLDLGGRGTRLEYFVFRRVSEAVMTKALILCNDWPVTLCRSASQSGSSVLAHHQGLHEDTVRALHHAERGRC